MLTCIYHPLDHFRVVEHDEAEKLMQSGVWFDCPNKAKAYKEQVECEIKSEKKSKTTKSVVKGQLKEHNL